MSVLLAALLVLGAGNPPPDPVARVGDRPIARRALDDAVQQALNTLYHHGDVSDQKLRALRRQELAELVRRELNLLAALDRGLPLPLVPARMQREAVEKQLGRKEYERSLKILGWTREQHARVLAEGSLADEAYERFVREASKVSDEDVRHAYAADPGRFRVPEEIHVEHILLAVAERGPDQAWAARESEARALLERLRAGEPFASLAAKSSDDPYRVKGGDLGWVHRGRFVEPLESSAWAAEPGELLGPLRSADGVHILRIVGRRDARDLTFEEAAPLLRRQLEQRALEGAEERFYHELRERHPVTILDPELGEGGG